MPALPGALLVVVARSRASWALDFAEHGIATVGPVAGGLPRPSVPTPPLADVLQLVPAALGVFLVSFADEILTARAFAGRRGEHVRASQELFVMSAANAVAGLTQTILGRRERRPHRGERGDGRSHADRRAVRRRARSSSSCSS